jgi:hypothetical protein
MEQIAQTRLITCLEQLRQFLFDLERSFASSQSGLGRDLLEVRLEIDRQLEVLRT